MAEAATDPALEGRSRVGRVLSRKWHIDSVLAVGGMATVYRATHRNGKRMAVKILHQQFAYDEQFRLRFLREGYAANKVDHPGALSIVDDDVDDDGSVYLVMELLEGESVADRMERRGGTLTIPEALFAADQVLDVLRAAHEKGIIHRDIKPANLFWTTEGAVKVLDFGLARVRDPSIQTAITSAGTVMGTCGYMSPEQARCEWDHVDGRADLFSVGAVMFRAMAGRPLHQAPSFADRLIAAMREPAPPFRTVMPEMPRCVVEVVDRALAFAPKDRFDSADSMQSSVRLAADLLGIELLPVPEAGSLIPPTAPEFLEIPPSLRDPEIPEVSALLVEETFSISKSQATALPDTVRDDPSFQEPALEFRPGAARVLVVENDELIRDLLVRRLCKKGFNVLVALNGREAVSVATSGSPDIILMDMSLPEMDAWEATRRIKQDPALAWIPIIALTAHAMPEDRAKALAAGCDEFETKPVDFVQLLGKMEAQQAASRRNAR